MNPRLLQNRPSLVASGRLRPLQRASRIFLKHRCPTRRAILTVSKLVTLIICRVPGIAVRICVQMVRSSHIEGFPCEREVRMLLAVMLHGRHCVRSLHLPILMRLKRCRLLSGRPYLTMLRELMNGYQDIATELHRILQLATPTPASHLVILDDLLHQQCLLRHLSRRDISRQIICRRVFADLHGAVLFLDLTLFHLI